MRPALTLVKPRDLNGLLKALYQVVKEKEELERWREGALEGRTEIRKKRQSMVEVKKAFANALHILDEAYLKYAEEIASIDGTLGIPDDRWTLQNTFRYLFKAKWRADHFQILYAGRIHKNLRDKPIEKQQASEALAGGIVAGTIFSHDYPARPDSREIDHWFIGAAADCLDQYKTGQGGRIPGYGQIILRLFQVAFRDEHRTLASINTEMQRQKKSGRPEYAPVLRTRKERQRSTSEPEPGHGRSGPSRKKKIT